VNILQEKHLTINYPVEHSLSTNQQMFEKNKLLASENSCDGVFNVNIETVFLSY